MLLHEALQARLRAHPNVTAVQRVAGGGLRQVTWAELEALVAATAEALPALAPGAPWRAEDPLDALVIGLALLHRGIAARQGAAGPEELALPLQVSRGRPSAGVLVRLGKELRGRDPAVHHRGVERSQEEVAAHAARLGRELGITAGERLLVTTAGPAAIEAGWAATVTGFTCCFADDPKTSLLLAEVPAWLGAAAQVAASAPPPSRAGPLGGLFRGVGRARALGRLSRVFADPAVPDGVAGLEGRGISVAPWPSLS